MIKGCQREMIVLQTKESSLFESAYFVLRRGCKRASSADMLTESNRIIGEGREYFTGHKRGGWLRPFLLGFLLCGMICGVGVWIFVA